MMNTSDAVFVMYVFSRLNGAWNWMAHESINAFACIHTKKPALKYDVSFTLLPRGFYFFNEPPALVASNYYSLAEL